MADSDSKKCQLCGHEPLVRFEVPRQTVLWKCPSCNLFQYGVLVGDRSYNSPHYHTDYELQRSRKVRTALVRLNRIAALVKEEAPRLLDVGCGIGAVMEAANLRGWKPVGSDVSQAVVDGCRQRGLECELIANDRLPFDNATFDVVTAWSVIEHVADVRTTLQEWRRVLRPGGILAIDTSNALCWKARLLGPKYRGFWPNGHTYTFTPATLKEFVANAGFRVLRNPFVGRISDIPFSQAAYSVGYQLQYELRQWLRLQKPFMMFAERVESPAVRKKAAA
jgi:ubiquinone/menaquinone biosynthesis C-methylase UbiE